MLIYFAVLLVLGIFGLALLFRGGVQRWVGGGIIVALLGFGVGPALLDEVRGNRLGAQMEAASFWPEDVRFSGSTVLLVGPPFTSCDALCEALFERADVEAIYLVGLSADQLAAPLTGTSLSDPATRVEHVAVETADSGYAWIGAEPSVLPASADWIIVRDQQGTHAQANAADIDLSPDALAQIASALHVYAVTDGRLAPTMEVTPVARMLTGWRTERPYFMPFAPSSLYANTTEPFSDALETWICGPITQDWDHRCPYLF